MTVGAWKADDDEYFKMPIKGCSSGSRAKSTKLKREVESDDEDEKPISRRSGTKATKPRKEECDGEDEKPISKRSSATKVDKEKELNKKKKGEEKKRGKKVYNLPGQKRDLS
ncbi:hypothetical protein GQ457_07G021400 [Hibiscus cannabinus]